MKRICLLAAAVPQGLVAVRAEAKQPQLAGYISELSAGFETFKRKHEDRLAEVEASIGNMAKSAAALRLNGGAITPVEPEYTSAFAAYTRSGDAEDSLKQANASGWRQTVHASMSVGDPSSGGYMAPTEWDRKVNQNLIALSPMRRLAQVQGTSVGAYSTIWNSRGTSSGWVAETDARAQTSTPTLASLTFDSGEIYANPSITQRLLDDAQFDVESFIAANVAEEFAIQEGAAFISGDGTNKPRGLLTYVTGGASDAHHPGGNLTVVNSGAAAALGADDGSSADTLVGFLYSLASPYRPNASWLMNSTTAAVIAKLKTSTGDYIWREAFLADQPATLLGRPVVLDENMPDLAAGATPIAFGDFSRGYVINDRLGVRILRDPYTAKPYVLYYTTKRVGGGVLDPKAVRLLKISA